MLKDFLICLSLANLFFMDFWASLADRSMMYHQKAPAPWGILAATICDELLLAVVFWAAVTILRRWPNTLWTKLARWALLLLLLIPLNMLRGHVLGIYLQNLLDLFGRPGFVLFALCVSIGSIFVLSRWNRIIFRLAKTTLILLAPLLPLSVAYAASFAIQASLASTFADKAPAPLLPISEARTPRVLWLIFDELDQRLAFEERPDSIRLPELDRLRAQSLYATHAIPPANETLLSMPALITGRLISRAKQAGPNELMITFQDSGKTEVWAGNPSVFSRARSVGFNSAVVGSYHPYCRVMGDVLNACSFTQCEWPFQAQECGWELSVFENMRHQMETQLEWVPFLKRSGLIRPDQSLRQDHKSLYLQIRQDALQAVTNTALGLILLHWPVPHPPGIYDRFTEALRSDGNSNYFDNLLLMDRAIGELRRIMEPDGTWDTTHVLLTADHSLRTNFWGQQVFWTREEALATGGTELPHVPFLLKLAGQKTAQTYHSPFNTIVTHDLILALLRQQLAEPESVGQWLDHHRTRAHVPPRADAPK